MIDIHAHIIPCVDDGTKSMASAIAMIKEEITFGVTSIICTPHYRKHMFDKSAQEILKQFNLLKEEVKKENLHINLYLGQEIFCHEATDIFDKLANNEIYTMNNKKYILLEFHYTHKMDVSEVVYMAKLKGYIPIIAHIERYEYLRDLETIADIVASGALIQVNASSIIGMQGSQIKKFCTKLLKYNFVDFVASDFHETRRNCLLEAYNYVTKKYSKEFSKKLFVTNAEALLEDISEA